MAEQDFFITIRTTADTAGIAKTEAELRKLGIQVESIKQAGAQVTSGAGLGSLAGRLAGTLAGGAGVGTIVNQVREYTAQLNKATAEIDKQAEKVVDLSMAWAEAAQSALTTEDVQKIATAGMADIDAFSKRITQIATQDIPAAMDSMTDIVVRAFKFAFTGDPNQKGPQQQIAENLMEAMAQQQAILKENAIFAIGLAETAKAKFEELTELPIDEAFARAREELDKLVTEQQNLKVNSQTFLEDYNKLTKEIQMQEAILSRLLQLDKQRKKEAQETAEEREKDKEFYENLEKASIRRFKEAFEKRKKAETFVQEQVERASPQARAALMNEQAAQLARDQGRQREADLYQRSAERFKQFATPAQKEEIAVLEELIEQNGLLREIRDAWR